MDSYLRPSQCCNLASSQDGYLETLIFKTVLLYDKASTISLAGIAPSRKICQVPSSLKCTIVDEIVRGDAPPSTISEIRSSQLLADLFGRRAFRRSAQIGRGRCDRNFCRTHHRQRNLSRWHAQSNIPRIRGYLQRQMRRCRHDHGQRPRPETSRQKMKIIRQADAQIPPPGPRSQSIVRVACAANAI